MKKRMIMIVLLCVMGMIMTSSMAAERIEDLPGSKNLLNLRTLYKIDNDVNGYSNDYMIKLNVGETYTLVMDYAYVDQCNSNMIEFEYENTISGMPNYASYQYDETNQRVYAEFVASETYINIFSVPVPEGPLVTNYNIILYEGDYASFDGYEPFVSNDFLPEETGSIAMDYDQMLTLMEIEALVLAQDPDGEPINKNIVTDTFSTSDKKPGTYQVVFQAESNLIRRSYILDITVYDATAPIISGPDALSYEISDRPTVSEISELFSITDNVDLNLELEVGTDTYTYAPGLGTFWIYFSATDSSGNTTTKQLPITLMDATPPQLHGPLDLYIYTTDIPYTEADILNTYRASDVVDGTCSVTIASNLYAGTTVAGIYEVVVSSADSQNNVATRTIYIHVIDNRGPSFITDELVIDTTTTELLSESDVLSQFVTHMAGMEVRVDHVEVLYNEYDSNETESGRYYVYLSYDVEGINQTSRILVNVEDVRSIFSPFYLIGIVPTVGLIALIIKKKRGI